MIGSAEHRRQGLAQLAARRAQVAEAELDRAHARRVDRVDAFEELGDPEQAERHGDQFEPVRQLELTKGEALVAGVDVGADQAEQDAQQRHRDALDRRSLRQRRPGEQAEQHQRADLLRAEAEGDPRDIRRQHDHLHDAERGADHRREHGHPQRDAPAPLLRHRVAVQACHRMRRMARQVQQDRADRTAVLGAVIDPRQHQQRGDRVHRKGERQQDRDGRQHAHTRQHADHVADEHAEEAPHDVVELQRNAEPVRQPLDARGDHVSTPRMTGNCTLSP